MKIKLLDGKEWDRVEILEQMLNDDFYYGYLGKAALSLSLIHISEPTRPY